MKNRLEAAQERENRFKREFKKVDQPMKAQLLGAWKELLIEEFIRTMKVTEDPELLGALDSQIALVREIIEKES
jgi:hypothetical protein